MRFQEHLDKMEEELNESTSYIDVWQGSDGEHKSSIGFNDKGDKAFVLGVISHNSKFMFDKKDVPKIIKLLKQKNSPLVKG